jgi:hypothetical protein
MEAKALNVIRTILVIAVLLIPGRLMSQDLDLPRIVNEAKFKKFITSNTNKFAKHPLFNKDSVKYESFYIILEVRDGRVANLGYSEGTKEIFSIRNTFSKDEINLEIDSKEFELVRIDQIIIPVIMKWIQFETKNENLGEALGKLIPSTGYTQGTYVMDPVIIYITNSIIN